jgi:hypothetical protein
MSDVSLSVSLKEAVAIVNLLGSLPTSQGAYPLFEKLKAQIEPLLNETDKIPSSAANSFRN